MLLAACACDVPVRQATVTDTAEAKGIQIHKMVEVMENSDQLAASLEQTLLGEVSAKEQAAQTTEGAIGDQVNATAAKPKKPGRGRRAVKKFVADSE